MNPAHRQRASARAQYMVKDIFAMKRKLRIRDVTLRDGQQSLFATRMSRDDINRVLPLYREAGFYAMEVWGGAVPDSVMRFLAEDPWERLESIHNVIGEVSKLTALSRGRNLFGYSPYPEEVIEGFNRIAVKSGISIMRIFDCLNDVDNMASTVKYVKQNGGIADCAVCYTVDSKFSLGQRIRAVAAGRPIPSNLFTVDYFLEKTRRMQDMGADMITLKDMAGLVNPSRAGRIIRAFKKELSVPIDFHTHCTPGYGLAATVAAIINGADVVDTAIMNFAGGSAAPAFELVQLFCDRLGIDTGVNPGAVNAINLELAEIRRRLAPYDSFKIFPREFATGCDTLPGEIGKFFDRALDAAVEDREKDLLEYCHKIEAYFKFPAPNLSVKKAEIPGGMYTNMLAQLASMGLEHLLDRVLLRVPQVRMDCGCPPLVTPSSQIVGAQAVNCVLDENRGKPAYSTVSTQFKSLVKGEYGKTPVEIDPDFRERICGGREARD